VTDQSAQADFVWLLPRIHPTSCVEKASTGWK
jgi:hypothetical protein